MSLFVIRFTQVGNCYTASVFAGLVSVVAAEGSSLEEGGGARMLMFSYGSGFIATAYRYLYFILTDSCGVAVLFASSSV